VLFTREPLVRTLGSSSASSTNQTQTQSQTEQMTLLSLLTALSSSSSTEQGTTNGALLSTLTAIDSHSSSNSGEEQPNTALVNALKELLAAATSSSHTDTGTGTINPALITNSHSHSHADDVNSSAGGGGEGEDEIIVLDKENVNPGAFRRKGEKGKEKEKKESGHIREQKEKETETERAGLGERSSAGNVRKRTLSDFMEEKEAERERAIAARGGSRKRAIPSSSSSTITTTASSSIQHTRSDMDYPFSSSSTTTTTSRIFSNSVLTANLAFRPHTSPPRPTFGSGPVFQRAVSFGGASLSSAANSPTPNSDALPAATKRTNVNPPKKYVVPVWARTNTTTQPRLSEEVLAQRAAAAAAAAATAEAEAEAEKEKEKTKKRGRGGKRKNEIENDNKDNNNKEPEGTKKKRPQLGTTMTMTNDVYSNVLSLPVCASSDVTVVSPSSPLPASSPTSDHAFSNEPCPKTPPPRHRRRHTLTPLSKNVITTSGGGGGGGSALFTPTPRKLSGLFDSPLFSPSASIASMKGKSKISPIRAVTSGKRWDAADLDEEEEDEDEDEEERLSRELDDALEELDAPSSSLPIASSDFDTELPPATSSSGGRFSPAEEEDETMRYWSTGLPPSSPPPPTSPVLQSQTDDEDMDDIGNAMSDSDGLVFEQDPLDHQQPQQSLSGISSDYMNSDIPFSDDLAMCFDDFNQFFSDPMTGTFITTNEEDTSLLPLPSSDPVVQNGITDFDFTQFWESVKPLVDQSMVASHSDGLASDGMMDADSGISAGGGEIDHVKLAEEVHALFSGCLM
jgi:hypothetical protein